MNNYSISKELGKCTLKRPIIRLLIHSTKDDGECSMYEIHKSISYQIATEWWDEKIDKG